MLIGYGRVVVSLRKKYIEADKKLFIELQKVLNSFKNEQKTVYKNKTPKFEFVENYIDHISKQYNFHDLCTITDNDFIKGVIELQNRGQRKEFSNQHFEEFLEMPFFEKLVGVSNDLLRTAIIKIFPTAKKGVELIATISDNLVEFDRASNECR